MPKIIDDSYVYRVATESLVKWGYEGATASRIAEAAGIHEATIFRKYGSKAELLSKAVSVLLADAPLSSIQYTGELRTDLQSVIRAFIDTSRTYGVLVTTVLVEAPRHPELRGALMGPLGNLHSIRTLVQRYQKSGELIQEPPEMTVGALLGSLMVRQMFVRAAGGMVPVAELDVEAYIDAFLGGRRATDANESKNQRSRF